MTTVILFTSTTHTQAVITTLRRAKNIKLLRIYKRIPDRIEPADVFVVADFGEIIPSKILNFTPTTREGPKYGSLCLHPSLLPKYRGASPVQQALIDGEKETGLTIFKMDEKVDHGPIIAQFKEKIRDDDTAATLYERLFAAGAKVLVTILPARVEGRIKVREQNHSKATYTKKLSREDGRINWHWPPEKIERFIRAMSPWPGAWCKGGPKCPPSRNRKGAVPAPITIKILKAHLSNGNLVIDSVQLPGKTPISFKQFQAGHKDWKLI